MMIINNKNTKTSNNNNKKPQREFLKFLCSGEELTLFRGAQTWTIILEPSQNRQKFLCAIMTTQKSPFLGCSSMSTSTVDCSLKLVMLRVKVSK